MKLLKKIKRIANCRREQTEEGTNNLPPIGFHPVCGENIRVSSNGAIAKRTESFCNGICFSSRPIYVNERVCIRFMEMSSLWSGLLRFGFTSKDPASYRNTGLPKYACPDLTSSGHTFAKALPEQYAQKGNVLHFYVSPAGRVHFGINGEEKGIILSNVRTNGPLWAVIDVYGNTTKIESVDPRHHLSDNCSSLETYSTFEYSPISSSVSMTDLPKELSRDPSPQIHSEKSLEPAQFHRMRGSNVRLSANKRVAERNSGYYSQGYVFAARPLMPNEKIIVQVLKTDSLYRGGLAFGLTSADFSRMNATDLPDDSSLLLDRPEYWKVVKDCAAGPQAGDELAFSIAPNGQVTMIKNRQRPVVLMQVDSNLPMFPFFDLYGSTLKIRLLGTSFQKSNNYRKPRLNPMLSKSMHSVNISPEMIYQQQREAELKRQSIYQPIYEAKRFYSPVPEAKQYSEKPQKTAAVAESCQKLPSEPQNTGKECTVCFEKQVNSVLYTCGHICMCYDCALKQWKIAGCCPICRAEIRDVIRTYWS